MKRGYLAVCLLAIGALTVVHSEVRGKRQLSEVPEDRARETGVKGDNAPVDYGWGPRLQPAPPRKNIDPISAIGTTAEGFREFDAATVPVGVDAHLKGQFGGPFSWPIIPIHVALLPNGKVYSYGTDTDGEQGATLWHALWDPTLGTDASAHTLLPNTTSTDTFCAAQSLLPSGKLMIAGGDMVVNGERNWSNNDMNVYDPKTNALVPGHPMFSKRWYPTLVALANGEMLVLGGRKRNSTSSSPATYASTPEVYTPATGWRTLTTAKRNLAYGKANSSWFYPRAFPAPNGLVFVLAHHGEMFYLDPSGTGSIGRATTVLAPGSSNGFPSVSIAPGKILSLRYNKRVIIVDLNKSPPIFKDTAPVGSVRYWSSATVLADGKVMVSGGSRVTNDLPSAKYAVKIWNPATGTWTLGDSAQKARLYHSIALLLPDATVLTAGGGAPGPVKNLNGEVYYPKYLFEADGSRKWADRPSIASAPPGGAVSLGQSFNVTVEEGNSIDRITLVRLGSVTHSFDADTRFTKLNFTQNGTKLTIAAPANARVATPGYWMLFVFDDGVPSVAKILHLT